MIKWDYRYTVGLVVAVLLILLLFLIDPALTGFAIMNNFEESNVDVSEVLKNVSTMKADLIIKTNDFESCRTLAENLEQEISKEKERTADCKTNLINKENELKGQLSDLRNNVSLKELDLKNQIREIKINHSIKINELYETNIELDDVIENAANNICCKARVDNKLIDSYIISNSKIICTSDEDNKIDCS